MNAYSTVFVIQSGLIQQEGILIFAQKKIIARAYYN